MFKKGDRVRCINDRGRVDLLTEGEEYTISSVAIEPVGKHITVDGIEIRFFASRFELVPQFKRGDLVEPQFKRGDKVLVWDENEQNPIEKIFIAYIEGTIHPYICVWHFCEDKYIKGEKFETEKWQHAKPIIKSKV